MGHGHGFFRFLHKRTPKPSPQDAPNSEHDRKTSAVSATDSGISQDLVPSGKEYAIEATKRTLEILTGVAGLVGVPLVKEVLDIGVSILSTCETINEVQEKVSELKNRVASWLLVIAKIAKDPETDSLLKSSQDLMDELRELKDCLATITIRLDAIGKQNVVLTTLLSKPNINTIEECVDCFQDAVARFQALRGIHAAQDLSRIQAQVEEVYQLARVAVEKMDVAVEKVDRVQSSVDKLQAMLESTAAQGDSFVYSTNIPPIPDNFLGRDIVVDRVAKQLANDDRKCSRICILGPGGMGKTSTALAVMDHAEIKGKFPKNNRLWIPCISLTSPASFLAFLARRLGIHSQADPLQSVISTFEHAASPYVILLDNFETPWHPLEGDQKLAREILQALDSVTNLSILLTMRSHFPPLAHWQAERLDVLPLEDCRRIYIEIEPRAEGVATEDLDLLLETIGCLPYAVTLMANQAKYADASPAELLLEWRNVGSSMLSDVDDNTKGMDSTIESSIKSKYVAGSPGAMKLLQVLSMLPAGVYREDISIWSKSWNLAALSTLRNAALILTREIELDGTKRTHYSVLPVVQSFMRQPGRIPNDICEATHGACLAFLRARASMIEGPNHPQFGTDLAAITSQESNLQTLLMEVLRILQDQANAAANQELPAPPPHVTSEQLDPFLVFANFQSHARPHLDLAERLAQLARQELPDSLLEAQAIYCLACIHYILRQTKSAYEGFRKAKELFLQLGQPLHACEADWRSVRCIFEFDHQSLEEQRQMVTETRSQWEGYIADPLIRAKLLYWSSERMWLSYLVTDPLPPEILQDMTEARDIYLSMNDKPWDLTRCLNALLRLLLGKKRIEDAYAVVQDILKLYHKWGFPDTGRNHYYTAMCLKAMNKWGPDLFTVLQDGLELARMFGSPMNVSVLLEQLVEVYVVEQDWAAAQLACEEVLKETRKASGYSIERVRDRAEWNLEYIQKSKQVDLEDGPIMEYWQPERW